MAKATLRIRVRVPWWTNLYLGACIFFGRAGLVEIDPERAAEFVVRHIRFEAN